MGEAHASATPAHLQVADTERTPTNVPMPRPVSRAADVFVAAGFWRRVAAFLIDTAAISVTSLLIYLLVSSITGLSLPETRVAGIDFWLDLILDGDPALLAFFSILWVTATIYHFVFPLLLSRTPGMHLLRSRIIDGYGCEITLRQASMRTLGHWVNVATLGLGYLWAGFDLERRALHDWIASTHVVKNRS